MIIDVARHLDALHTASTLTEDFRRKYRPGAVMVRAEKVIRILREAGVRFVVMGTHGVNGYRDEPRATQDVDILVRASDHQLALDALRKAYRRLQVQDTLVVTRLVEPTTGKVVIDLMKPSAKLLERAFQYSVFVGDSHAVPDLEMALASKYAAMVSPNRSLEKKYLDAGDFINMVRNNQDELDLKKLKKLGELVYKGGGKELLDYIEDALAGRTLQL